MRKLKPIESRGLALLLAALVLLVAWLVLVQWWFIAPLRSVERTIRSLRDSEQRYSAIVAQRDMLRDRLTALSQGGVNAGALLSGTDANAATAALMQRVVNVVREHSGSGACRVTRKMPLPASSVAHSSYREIGAEINMSCSMAALTTVLYQLRHGKLYVFVHGFNVYSNIETQADGRGATQSLEVQLTISGYMRARATGSTP